MRLQAAFADLHVTDTPLELHLYKHPVSVLAREKRAALEAAAAAAAVERADSAAVQGLQLPSFPAAELYLDCLLARCFAGLAGALLQQEQDSLEHVLSADSPPYVDALGLRPSKSEGFCAASATMHPRSGVVQYRIMQGQACPNLLHEDLLIKALLNLQIAAAFQTSRWPPPVCQQLS